MKSPSSVVSRLFRSFLGWSMLVIVVLLRVPAAYADPLKWEIQTVDNGGNVGLGSSIAISDYSKRIFHISYIDATNKSLKYATNSSGSWVTTTIDNSGVVGSKTAIGVDYSGKVHICYSAGTILKYATNASGPWVITTIGSISYPYGYISLAIGSDRNVHIAYRGYGGELNYATNASGTWVTTYLASDGRNISIDAYGTDIHISYCQILTNTVNIKYATNSTGTWTFKTIENFSSDHTNYPTSITRTWYGDLHISYFAGYPDIYLKYAKYSSGAWTAGGKVAGPWTCLSGNSMTTSIAALYPLGGVGEPVTVAYSSPDGIIVRWDSVMCNSELCRGSLVVPGYGVQCYGQEFSMAAEPLLQYVAVSFYDDATHSLKLATQPPDLHIESVSVNPSSPAVGQGASVEVTIHNGGGAGSGSFVVDLYKHLSAAPAAYAEGDFSCSILGLPAGLTTTCAGTVSYGSPGSYSMWAQVDTDQQVVEAEETNNVFGPQTIAVTSAQVLTVTPAGGLAASGVQGGPFNPSSQSYILQNTGGGVLNWTAAKTQSWTTLSPASGTLAAGASTTVSVSINSTANGLLPGSYSDSVTFANTTNGNGNTSRPVSLTVNTGLPSVTVTAKSPTATEAGPTPGVYRISRTGSMASSLTVYFLIGGTATNGTDYVRIAAPKTIPAGSDFVDVTLTPIDDGYYEDGGGAPGEPIPEKVVLTLVKNVAYSLGSPSSATVSIVSDDAQPTVTVTAKEVWAAEGIPPVNGIYRISRSGGSLISPLRVYFTLGGIAINGADYATITGPRTIPAGSGFVDVTLVPVDDGYYEDPPEAAILTLKANPTDTHAYAVGSPASATVYVKSNDAQPKVTAIAADAWATEKGLTPGTYQISRSGGSMASPLTVYFTLSGTATPGLDYEGIPGMKTIPANATSVIVTLTPRDDGYYEDPPETAILTLKANPATPNAYAFDPSQTATISIESDDARPTVSVVATVVGATEVGTLKGRYQIKRSGGSLISPLKVYFTLSGKAINGTDYVRITSPQTIAPGSNVVDVSLTAINDSYYEPVPETAVLTLVADPATPGAYAIDPVLKAATVSITSDDPPPTVTVIPWDPTATEAGLTPGTFRISRSGPTNSYLFVYFDMSGSATKGKDYASIASPKYILPGKSYVDVTLTPINDTLYEPTPETATLTLRPSATTPPAYTVGASASATVSIESEDAQTRVSVGEIDTIASEVGPDTGKIRIYRSFGPGVAPLSSPLTVYVKMESIWPAINGTDYVYIPSTVTIPANAYSTDIILTPKDDLVSEPIEAACLVLVANEAYTIITSPIRACVYIQSNE